MTESSTITAPSASERYSPNCPDWCTMTRHQHEEATAVAYVDDGSREPVVDHAGPSFGPFFTSGAEYLLSGRPLSVTVEGEISPEVFSASELRQLAADALAAAEWLEAQS